jgi:methyl-accepting chemotaxis protein
MKKSKRRQYLVDKKMQYHLLFITIIYFLAILFVVGISLFVPLMSSLHATDLDPQQRSIIADEILYLHARFWPAFIFITVILSLHSLFVSHRIAGPLYRFRKAYQAVADGDLSRTIHIRKYDYLHEEEEYINTMIGAIGSRIKDIQLEYQNMAESLGRISSIEASGAINSEVLTELTELEEKSRKLKEKLDFFKVEPPESGGDSTG